MDAKPLSMLIGALVLAGGCATPAEESPGYGLPAGTAALVSARYAPEKFVETHSEYFTRWNSRAARWGAASAEWGFKGPALAALTNPIALPLVLLTPVTTLVGGAVGSLSGAVTDAVLTKRLPVEQQAPLDDLVGVSVDQRLQGAIAERLALVASARPRYRVVLMPELGPQSSADAPDYRGPASQGHIDSVVELRLTRGGLLAMERESPVTARLELEVTVRMVPLNDESRASWTREDKYMGEFRDLAEWRDEDGRVLAAEIDKACEELVKRIADFTFVVPSS